MSTATNAPVAHEKAPSMTPHEFIAMRKPVALTERAGAHSHFLDLCALLGYEDPVRAGQALATTCKGIEYVS